MSRQTTYILDDDGAFVDSLVWMLEGLGYAVEGYTDIQLAINTLEKLSALDPSCLLLDIRMPQMSGLAVHDHLLASGIDLPIIYLTGHGDVSLAVEAMSKGALTFLEKPVDQSTLERVMAEAFSAGIQTQRQSAEIRLLAEERAQLIATLTPREAEVLTGVVEGLSARKIGEVLFISPKTVDFHKGKVMSKLKANNIAQLQRIVALSPAAVQSRSKDSLSGSLQDELSL